MTEPSQNPPVTVPEQPQARPPLSKSMPVVIALVVIIALIGIANVSSLLHGAKKMAPLSAMSTRPVSPNAQQVASFETQQQLQAQHDAEGRQRQQQLAAAMQQLQAEQAVPEPEALGTPPMTAAQRAAIYSNSPDAPVRPSELSQVQAEAKQRRLAIEKQEQDALNSDTLAIDFEHPGEIATPNAVVPTSTPEKTTLQGSATTDMAGHAVSAEPASDQTKTDGTNPALTPYDFDTYEGALYRVFEGTVLEGVVTTHIDGGFNGSIMFMVTTDLYSHDHQQLLIPQGTFVLGEVQAVGSQQQRKMFITFHRAITPDGFSLWFAKYIALDQIGTTGLATKVDHGYLQAFAAAAAVGGLRGLAQIGNNGSVLSPSTQIRNGISAQSAAEGEQILNHFLNRLPVITLKEGSRARVYIGTDLLIPSYAEHRVNPAL
jgi:type IV secretory pathway VirB10-like protein